MRDFEKEFEPMTAQEFDAFKRALLYQIEHAATLDELRAALVYILTGESDKLNG